MEHDELTIAEVLHEHGYQSAYIGKWHLGDDDWYPTRQGFDVNFGGCDYGQPPSYFDPFNQPKHRHAMIRAGIPGLPGRKKGEYLTHREADEAVKLIRDWKDKPFFLQVAHYAVHTPIQAIDGVAAKYRRDGKHEQNARYAAMVESVDDSTKQILDTLEELGIDDRTVVLFTSDNGGLDRNGRPTDNAPLRSGKGYPYEGGIRVPFLVRWPGVVKPQAVSDAPVCSIDIFPTLLTAAGIELPEDRTIDGLSLVDHLKSAGEQKLPRDELLWHFPHYRHAPGPYSILRKGDLKLIRWDEGVTELYDLGDDLAESHDLAESRPEQVQQKGTGARLTKPNPAYRGK